MPPGEIPYKKEGVLIRYSEKKKKTYEVPRSCFVGMA